MQHFTLAEYPPDDNDYYDQYEEEYYDPEVEPLDQQNEYKDNSVACVTATSAVAVPSATKDLNSQMERYYNSISRYNEYYTTDYYESPPLSPVRYHPQHHFASNYHHQYYSAHRNFNRRNRSNNYQKFQYYDPYRGCSSVVERYEQHSYDR